MVEWPCEEDEEACEAEEDQWLVPGLVEDMEIKDGVDKEDMEEVMDGEMEVPNGVVDMVKARMEGTEEAMEGLKDMVEVRLEINLFYCQIYRTEFVIRFSAFSITIYLL